MLLPSCRVVQFHPKIAISIQFRNLANKDSKKNPPKKENKNKRFSQNSNIWVEIQEINNTLLMKKKKTNQIKSNQIKSTLSKAIYSNLGNWLTRSLTSTQSFNLLPDKSKALNCFKFSSLSLIDLMLLFAKDNLSKFGKEVSSVCCCLNVKLIWMWKKAKMEWNEWKKNNIYRDRGHSA